MYGYFFCQTSIMKQNINPVTLFSIKEGARVESTLFETKWELVPVKLAALLKRNFPCETFISVFCEAVLLRFYK